MGQSVAPLILATPRPALLPPPLILPSPDPLASPPQHFIFFALEFDLIDRKELAPLQEIIDEFTGRQGGGGGDGHRRAQ